MQGNMTEIKAFAARLLGDTALGWIDFIRSPERGAAWGGPFNGQRYRQALFHQLINAIAPPAIVETGTYLGATTELLAQTGLPVFTIEGQLRHYGFARARLRQHRNVMLSHGDSRAELRKLFKGALSGLCNDRLFCYLDAHWNEDLPLAEEIQIIFSGFPNAVVMIDDFEVPGDSGFGYDHYGPGRALNASYVAPMVETHDLALFYPSTPSSEESGLRRGCAVLCKTGINCEKLQMVSLLRSS
jgi:hypothetical protein